VVIRLEEDAEAKARGMGRRLTVMTMRNSISVYSEGEDDGASALDIILPEYEEQPALETLQESNVQDFAAAGAPPTEQADNVYDFGMPGASEKTDHA
jgi:hypothetical protein